MIDQVLRSMFSVKQYLTNKEGITGLKCYKFVEIEENIEKVPR